MITMDENHPRFMTQGERANVIPDLVREVRKSVLHVASNVNVNWSWYNENQGVVQWMFKNSDSKRHSVILLRNGYYFAGAFWPVYYANSSGRGASATNPSDNFGTDFLDGKGGISPLVDKGVANNNPPLGLITFGNSNPMDVTRSNSQVLFVFTLEAGESWSMLEGGFSPSMTPTEITLYEVTPVTGSDFCIGYDEKRVTDWDNQTKTSLKGYSPDPTTFDTWLLSAENGAPFDELPYTDTYSDGNCPVSS